MSNRFNIAGTGHRPPVLFANEKYPYDKKHLNFLISFAEEQIKYTLSLYKREVARIISGMAQGWDTAIAHAAINLGLPLLAAVPFDDMDAKWPQESKDDYQYLISKAAKVVVVSPGGYESKKFYLRDKYMVDNADLVLALYNGYESSGTGITVKYADQIKKPIKHCWPDWIEYEKKRQK